MKTVVVVGVVVALHGVAAALVFLAPGCRAPDAGLPERQIAVMPEPITVTPVPHRPEVRPPAAPPAAPPVIETPRPVNYKEYVVQSGDVISRIARRTGVSVAEIVTLNHLSDPDQIRAGQTLVLPPHARIDAPVPAPPRTPAPPPPSGTGEMTAYEVQPGDALSMVAQRFGTTVQAIMQANGLADPHNIRAGQTLMIPGRAREQQPPVPRPERQPAPQPPEPIRAPAPETKAVSPPAVQDITRDPLFDPEFGALLERSIGDTRHIVGQGETLEDIARFYGRSADEIQRYNNLGSRHLQTGQTLKIPHD